MTIEYLQELLENILAEKKNKPSDNVCFRETDGRISSVDYVLTKQVDNTLLLCEEWY